MAQDVSKKMAEEPWVLNEDGYLNADTDIKEIVYHPTLNVILLCTKSGIVKVLDVNTGVVLQSSNLSAINHNQVTCRYIPGQDRILFTDGQAIGVRSEYNGVLLLDSILQKIISDPNEDVRVELPLSEAIILKQSLLSSGLTGVDHILTELTNLISNAQKCDKKGIKAQKWNTICLRLPLNELRSATMSTVTNILAKNLHTPELAVASAIQERMSELLGEVANASDRRAMASESKRRDTFSQWPHMDYKWALPEQMAQAGFYHQPNQPNAPGEDRALCFTCSVCLVCWEKTDEPWSEHERHSQNCPFMMGEYTHNVPISVIFASNPAIDATYRGMSLKVLGTSAVPNLIPASNDDGLISIFDISGKITRPHSFYVSQYDSYVLDKITQEFSVLTNEDGSNSYPTEKSVTALSIIDQKASPSTGTNANTPTNIRPTVICGLKIKSKQHTTNSALSIQSIDENDPSELISEDIEITNPLVPEKSCLFLVVYDFLFQKKEQKLDDNVEILARDDKEQGNMQEKEKNVEFIAMNGIDSLDEIHFSPKYLIKHFSSFYKAFIPGESDEICLPPTDVEPKKWFDKKWPESRVISSSSSEADSCSPLPCLNQDNILFNGQISNVKETTQENKSISDHINELKSKRLSKKLNYSRAVQCITLPNAYKNRNDLIISDILTTVDGCHILIVLKSMHEADGVLLLYKLDFSNSMVMVNPTPIHSRELSSSENPVQVILLPAIEKFGNSSGSKAIEGDLVMVCSDGAVRIVELATMKTICYAKLEGEKFTSAAYCNSLERLCVSTEEGSLHFYVLNDTDNESLEDHEDDDLFCTSESTAYSSLYTELTDGSEMRCFHEPTALMNLTELKKLYSLTQFEPLRAGYCAVVPPCWTEIQQAQRQRRHPQSLSVDGEAYTKTWRLQTDLTTWDEHIFEISLPCPMILGHVDVHFTLQPSTTSPHVEVTLLKQNSNGIGHKRDVTFSVDESITIGMLQWADNPVISQEYLRSHNADILAGPINIASSLDLSEQSGVATLTSPKLFKSRNRTLLLHLRVVYSKEEECNRQNKNTKKQEYNEEASFTSRKSETYMGCDCIHELSITVYASKHTELLTQIATERHQRSLMLESNVFVLSLIYTLINDRTSNIQSFVLDLLNWIASIRLTRNRSNNGEAPIQQIEFISIMENQLQGIIHRSFLSGGRSLAHRCAKLITTCSRGARNINDSLGETFDIAIMNNLLTLLDSIGEVKSAGSLQWFFNILVAVTPKSENKSLATNCKNLLVKISDELAKKTNPYHLLLRTRYGLYGTPMEPELFDVEPPPYPKGSSVSITYASVVSGETSIASSDFYSTYSFYKEIINPKEVMSTADNVMKCKNISSSRLFKGLIETEPLHFVCVSASEGTRLDKADESNSVMSNIVVNNVPIAAYTDLQSGTSKKDDIQLFWNNVIDMMNDMKNFKGGSQSLSEKFLSHLKNPLNAFIADELGIDANPLQVFSDGFRGNKQGNKLTTSKNMWQMEDILSPEFQVNNIWQHLLVGSPQQVIVVERMHSGARRFVILDFGQPVLLTDLLIPACNDLVSVSIDVWLKSEDVDPTRIAVSFDIGSRNLVLNDLLPPPVCRFVKITVVGRYGMSTTRCRIPIGFFYGHMVIKSDELSNEISSFVKASSSNDTEKHLANLSKLFEDISCRYSISCSKLKDTLQGFIVADVKNASHLLTYMNTMKEKNSNVCSLEHNKVFQAYREAITYQRQLNTVRHIMNRLEERKGDADAPKDLFNISTDKLVAIAEGLLEVLLSIDFVNELDIDTCQKLFHGFCVSQSPRLQFLAATYLKNTSAKCDFWGNFLADILSQMFSSTYSQTFPQDRVFTLIAYLSKLSPHRSSVLDASLRVTYECLNKLEENRKSLLAISVDLPLLSWLLMYLSLQLDMNKNSNKSVARWDWVFGEMLGKATIENTKTRLHKKALKKQIGTIDSTSNKMPLMHKVSIPIPNITNTKNGQEFFMKMLNYSMPDNDTSNKKLKDKKNPQTQEEKSSPKKNPLYVDEAHIRAVATGLINLILSMDHSSSADMLLLSFKVIARLSHLSKSSYFVKLRLGHLMNETQLLDLVNFCLKSKIPWVTHALACLLEDFLDLTPLRASTEVEGETASVPSTSWESTNEAEMHNDIFEDEIISASFVINNKNKQLPSVYESDSSEIEELVEEVFGKEQNQSKKRSGKTVISSSSCLSSCAIDSRLDLGVETLSEINLRKLLHQNNQTLVQKISVNYISQEKDKKLLPWSTTPQHSAPKTSSSNHKMLMECFQYLFQGLDQQPPESIEHILQLWLTLNSPVKGDKFDRSKVPIIALKPESVHSLISVLVHTSGLSLGTWCISLQTLALVCNTPSRTESNMFPITIANNGMARKIVEHPEFTKLLLRLLSEDWVMYSEKGLAGPSLCQALYDLLIVLQTSFDVMSNYAEVCTNYKNLLLKTLYHLIQPSGPIGCRQGPLDAQCKLIQSMLILNFENADLDIAMGILENTGDLVHSYVTNNDRIRCYYSGEMSTSTFRQLYSTVLGTDAVKQERPVSYEYLLITLLKLSGKLVKTRITQQIDGDEPMETEPINISQTDESKAEQIQQNSGRNTPCLADRVLQHHPCIIKLCSALSACKSSSICMLACISQKFQSTIISNFSEPNSLADGVFYVLISLAKCASEKEFLMQPLLMFLSQTPVLSEPLIWFILQILENEDTIRCFFNAGGLSILSLSFVKNISAPNTISKTGTISTVMQFFNKTKSVECNVPTTSSKKSALDEQLENRLSLVNFAPCSSIKCSSTTAQPADILIQGNTTTHRRARTPQWSYHFYPEEVYTELVLTLPSAILLKQVHLQPHSIALSTCPSAVGLEISASGPSRLVPVGPPMTTSGMPYIQLDLPTPEVVKCILIRLYKPKMANNISLSQIRLLGFPAFNEKLSSFVADNEQLCKQSLGWIRLLHHCFSVPTDTGLIKNMVACCASVPDLLASTCGLLLVPSHVLPDYLPCLEKVVRELSLHNLECSMITLKVLLESKCSSTDLLNSADNLWQDHLLVNNNGYQSTCELLYQICEYQDENTPARISTILDWVQNVARNAFATGVINECNPAYFSYVASILWHANSNPTTLNYDMKSMITVELFDCVVRLESFFEHNLSLKYSLDSLLCSICYIQPDFYPILLRHFGILIPNLSNDHSSSIPDDRKGTNSLTDDNKNSFVRENPGWYNHLVVSKLAQLEITNGQLETVALVSRSPTSVQQLLDSGLPKILISAILEFCTSSDENEIPMAKLEKISAILKFFTEVSEEKLVRDWLGSEEGSSFWLQLLQWLCRKTSFRKCTLESETNVQLEEMYIKFLSKCCLCHPPNQDRLARVLCEVISQQTGVITGFMRRLVLQLLLENEKIPVNITADETLYKSVKTSHVFFPTHPAFKQTYKRALLHLSTTTTLSDILEEHIYFNPHKIENSAVKKEVQVGNVTKELKGLFSEESDLSVAAGVLAKDKRAKDNKNLLLTSTPVKKKRYSDYPGGDFIEGRAVKCLAYSNKPLPLNLTLGQLLKLIESKRITSDWPCIHLTISHNKDASDKIGVNNETRKDNGEADFLIKHQSYSSSLQVFSAMGGLALLAQHLPTIYPETIRSAPNQKMSTDQSDSDWIKVEECDDIYEDDCEKPTSLKSSAMVSIMPPYSLTAFGLFLRLPGYAEILLKDMKEALCLLRLVLGVTDDDEGGDIFQSPLAPSLPTLPFEVLRKLFDATKLNTDDGRLLRRMSISNGVIHLILVCLGIFTHMTPAEEKESGQDSVSKEERSQLYWAKGTGYGTGSTQQSWNVEQALLKQKSEEEHVTILLQVLASYINPNGEAADELAGEVLPTTFHDLLLNSCLLPVLSSYLRNDSVLDMARHIPLYKAVLLLLRAIAVSSQLLDLLLPQKSMGNQPSISSLLKNMKNCVDTYTSKLLNTKSTSKSKLGVKLEDVEQDEGLANLMPDIQDSATLVSKITSGLVDSDNENEGGMGIDKMSFTSLEEQYISIMKKLQFGSYEMIMDLPEGGIKFVISHHFESNAKATGEQSHPARVKRIAQETVTLSSSLPLSYSSSVFVRYDTSRLDVMKVLITGPSDTPYANGCFELDVFFPHDYPLSPMMINLETTGHHSVRFNPNLYNDGKVCLSVLNTWHGRPEEKWNVQTSSFLQVLVSIQSLILVPEPYFNEPGYERSRGTPAGNQSSREYNATICQATVRWAMLEQIMNPCPCFAEIILTHFYLKRYEIIEQVEGWVKEFENEAVEKKVSRTSKRTSFYNLDQFKKVVQQLKEQLLKLKPPASLKEDEDGETTPTNCSPVEKTEIQTNELDNDIEMQKMVNDMCE